MTPSASARIEDLFFLDDAEVGAPEAARRVGMNLNALEKFCERYGIYPLWMRLKHRGHHCNSQCPVPPSRPAMPHLPNPPETTMADDITDLIETGQAHTSKRIQAAAKRAEDAIEKLRDALAAEEAKAEAQAEVSRLERELREAKARAKGQPATVAARPPVARVDTKKIRTWAHAQGIQCPDRGRVPNAVLDAYDKAQRTAS